MSTTTIKIKEVRDGLCDRFVSTPGVSINNAYNNLLRDLLATAEVAYRASKEMDQDKSDHRCR